MKTGLHWTADSLADIAGQFETEAAELKKRAGRADRKRDAADMTAEARGWERAAAMLRATTLIEKKGEA